MHTLVPQNVLIIMAGIFSVLGLCSFFLWATQERIPPKVMSELSSRVKAWWVMCILFAIALLTSVGMTISFFAFVSFLALKEYLSLIPIRRADRRVLFWAYVSIFFQYYWIYINWYGMFIVFIPVYVFLLLPLRMLIIGETKGFLRAIGTVHWGLITTVFSLSHVAFMLMLPDNIGAGYGLVLYLVFLTQFNDIAQYTWGKLFGKRRVLPKISPQKTWVGLIGGLLSTGVVSVLVSPWLTPFSHQWAFLIGVLIAASGFVGDLTISAVKRDLQIKDCSQMLPGHGGILDRVDSLTYTAPLFFHLLSHFYY